MMCPRQCRTKFVLHFCPSQTPTQVPQAIAAALKHQPGQPAPSFAVQMACVDSLLVFSTAAADSSIIANTASSVGTLTKQLTDGVPLTPQNVRRVVSSLKSTKPLSVSATGLALSAVKQLQKSGVLELLPHLLSDAAAALAGLSDAAILAWAAGTSQQGSELLPGGSSIGSVVTLQNHAHASFSLFGLFWQDLPFEDTVRQQVLGPSLLPALQLLSTVHQFVGRCADLLPADSETINPRTLLEMQWFVTSATEVLAGVLQVVLQATLTALQAAQSSRAGQGTAGLGSAPGPVSDAAAALWEAPAIKAVASADLLGACCLALLTALSGDLLQPLLQAHKLSGSYDTIACVGVAASGVDGSSSSSSSSGSGTTGRTSSSRMPASSSSGSSKAAGTLNGSRKQPIAEDANLTSRQNAAVSQLACSNTLQLPSPFTHMLSLLGYSRRALIFTLMTLHDNHRGCDTAAGVAAPLTAAPRHPIPAPGWLLEVVSSCLMLAGAARQSAFTPASTMRRLSTTLRTMEALPQSVTAACSEQQQHGHPEPQGNSMPNQQQHLEQQQTETKSDADWEAQMHHTLLAVVLVWLGQKDATANSYAESLSGAADVMSQIVSWIGDEWSIAEAEALSERCRGMTHATAKLRQFARRTMQSAQDPFLPPTQQQQQQQLAQGITSGVTESAVTQCSLPGEFQDQRIVPDTSPWVTPAMQEVGLVQLLSTACQQLLDHLDSLPADSTAAAHIAGQSSAASQGRSSSGASSSTAPSGITSSTKGPSPTLDIGSNSVSRSKATSSNSSGRTASRGNSSSSSSRNDTVSRSSRGGDAHADTLKAVASVAESISLLAWMSLPDQSCKGYWQHTPAQNPFLRLLSTAQPELQYALYLHHSTTSLAYTTWRQQFVRLASLLEVHVRASAASNSPLLSFNFKQALTAGSCLLNPNHLHQLRPGKWVATVAMDAALQAGPGSREEQQLFSLACSLLKACSIRLMGGQLDPVEQQDIEAHMMAIGTMACSLIMQATMLLKGQAADSGMSSGGTSTAAVSSTSAGVSLVPGIVSSSSDGPSSSNSSSCMVSSTVDSTTTTGIKARSAVLVVPWLVLLGRFCLCWSSHALTGGVKSSPQAAPGSTQETAQTELLLMQQQAACTVSVCLGDPSILSELAAAGYDTVALAAELAAAQAAAEPELNSPTTKKATWQVAVQYLCAIGLVLTKLPFKLACNNPLCSNMAGLSELQLVSGRARCCSGCRVARYCSEACQRKHWKQHKPACKALAAAVAAAKPQ